MVAFCVPLCLPLTFSGLAKVAILTTNVDAEHQFLINHKCVCGALNPLLRQTAVMRSPFLARACSCVHCLVDVPWLGGSFVVFVWLCAFGKTANVPPNALLILSL